MGCHTVLGLVARGRDDLAGAVASFARSEALAAELGLDEDVTIANTNLAEVAMDAGDYERARERSERTLARNRASGLPPVGDSHARIGLGDVARRQGFLDEADGHFARAHELAAEAGFPHNAAVALVGLAGVAVDRGRQVEAATMLGQARRVLKPTGAELTGADAEAYDEVLATLLGVLGAARLASLLDAEER